MVKVRKIGIFLFMSCLVCILFIYQQLGILTELNKVVKWHTKIFSYHSNGLPTGIPDKHKLKNIGIADRVSLHYGFIKIQQFGCFDLSMQIELPIRRCIDSSRFTIFVPFDQLQNSTKSYGKGRADTIDGMNEPGSSDAGIQSLAWRQQPDSTIMSKFDFLGISVERNDQEYNAVLKIFEPGEGGASPDAESHESPTNTDGVSADHKQQEPSSNGLTREEEDEGKLDSATSSYVEYFRPKLTQSMHETATKLLNDISMLLQVLNSTAWMGGGTALGSIRHGGRIAWDDDLDYEIPISDFIPLVGVLDAPSYEIVDGTLLSKLDPDVQKKRIRIVLRQQRYKQLSFYSLGRIWWKKHKFYFNRKEREFIHQMQLKLAIRLTPFANQWSGKVFYKNRPKMSDPDGQIYPWSYPYLDFFAFFPDIEKRVFHSMCEPNVTLSFEEVFPLHYRPFDELSLPMVHRPAHLLHKTYKSDVTTNCYSGFYDHINQSPIHGTTVQCERLYNYVAFIRKPRSVKINFEDMPIWLRSYLTLQGGRFTTLERFWQRHGELMKSIKARFNITFDASTVIDLVHFDTATSTGWDKIWTGRSVEKGIDYEVEGTVFDMKMEQIGTTLLDLNSWKHVELILSEDQLSELRKWVDMILGRSKVMREIRNNPIRVSCQIEDVWKGDSKILTYLVFGGDYTETIIENQGE